ncbi:MAG: dihydrofolate reductase [Fischerella sp.]|nr:dihydrofolate reductase [Fischerella sp.]
MINAIFAVDRTGGLGFKGSLPWNIPEDLAFFKKTTLNSIVVMGRRTWDDPKMPKPLPNRENYVITNRPIIGYNVKTISGDIKKSILSLEQQNPNTPIFILGGKEILLETRDILDNIYLTYVNSIYRIDTRIDMNSFLSGFRALSADYQGKCTFMTFKSLIKDATISQPT